MVLSIHKKMNQLESRSSLMPFVCLLMWPLRRLPGLPLWSLSNDRRTHGRDTCLQDWCLILETFWIYPVWILTLWYSSQMLHTSWLQCHTKSEAWERRYMWWGVRGGWTLELWVTSASAPPTEPHSCLLQAIWSVLVHHTCDANSDMWYDVVLRLETGDFLHAMTTELLLYCRERDRVPHWC